MNRLLAEDILRKAQTDIKRRGFVQGADALNALGQPCLPTSAKARKWCITGALLRHGFHANWNEVEKAIRSVARGIGLEVEEWHQMLRDMWAWEDDPSRSVDDVLLAMSRAADELAQ
jgi:hypothetical protein